jgi:hypothetical protein
MLASLINPQGLPYVTPEQEEAAERNIRNITPSSPFWTDYVSSDEP